MKIIKTNFELLGLVIGAFVLLYSSSCKRPELAPSCSITDHVLNDEGECVCPDGTYDLGDKCLEKSKRRYFVEFPEDCGCVDKVTIEFYAEDFDNNGIMMRNFILNTTVSSGGGMCVYTEKPDGDEVDINRTLDVMCTLHPGRYLVRAHGKFNAANTEMVMQWTWLTPDYEEINTCEVVLKQ